MTTGPLWTWPATDLAAAIRRRDVSAVEVMRAHIDRIEQVNPPVNAIVTFEPERALEAAAAVDARHVRREHPGALAGLPIAHKDLLLTRGMRTTFGSPIYRDYVPTESSLVVERVQAAGAIPLGKTNTPEFGAGSQTFNRLFGPTRNPFDTSRTCGGSTGGGAVALACGMLPIADGTDMGGSLRNPAAFCGVVGLRPTPGLVPVWPAADAWSVLSVDGPMARTVADVALLLSVMSGDDPRSPIAFGGDPGRFAGSLERDLRGVRVGWWRDLGGIPFEREVVDVVNGGRRVFEALGCVVDEAEPQLAGADEVFKVLRAAAFVTSLGELVSRHRGEFKDTILWEVDRGLALTAEEIAAAIRRRTDIYHRVRGFFEHHDCFVLPTTQVAPFDVAEEWVRSIDGVPMTTYIDWMKSCYFISITGCPSISVPCGYTASGLPVGMQIVAPPRADLDLLRIAYAFERAAGVGRQWPAG